MCAMINHFIKQHNVVWTKIVFVHQRLTGKRENKRDGEVEMKRNILLAINIKKNK